MDSNKIFSFGNKKKTIVMLEGAYRKLKSYFYYNKNFILLREKIVFFEANERRMQSTFQRLAEVLQKPNLQDSQSYFQNLIKKINFYVLPKKFESPEKDQNDIVSNVGLQNRKLNSVNFFIDAPIEIHILDVLFAFFIARASQEKKLISENVYGNCVYEEVLNTPNFESRRFFKTYFPQYCNWRDGAFKKMDDNYKHNVNSILISLDFQKYFYSVRFDFDCLKTIKKNTSCNKVLCTMEKIFQPIYSTYKHKIKKYRKDLVEHKENEFPLPIGLFSSMVLGNVYLADFDRKVTEIANLSYYGRYVDDCLFVVDAPVKQGENSKSILNKIFDGILETCGDTYFVTGKENIRIQLKKVKVIHIEPHESRALLDIYNKEVKLPSQMNPLPLANLNLDLFDENAYNVENLSDDGKIRNIGTISANALSVGSFFSSLLMKFAHVNPYSSKVSSNEVSDNKEKNIEQINRFFSGSNIIEYSSHWMSFFYFLISIQQNDKIRKFYYKVKHYIDSLDNGNFEDSLVDKPPRGSCLITIVKRDLKKQLEIALYSALALDIESISKKSIKKYNRVKSYIKANMFNHFLVALPLANFLEYDKDVSYIKLSLENIGRLSSVENSFKLKWSPRYIGYEEILCLRFYRNYDNTSINYKKGLTAYKIYTSVNYISRQDEDWWNPEPILEKGDYDIQKFLIQPFIRKPIEKINVAVANMKLDDSIEKMLSRWENLSFDYKKVIHNIFEDALKVFSSKQNKNFPSILILPEASIPIYWLDEIIKFSKKSKIAIIAGLQLVNGKNTSAHNYILHIFPFSVKYLDTALVAIREKNDYSPYEKKELSKLGRICKDREFGKAVYFVFDWYGVQISSMVCFELTDIGARAKLKDRCHLLAVPVFNKDTRYFSNIIESTARDLHVFVVQANTSTYGDSRITAPYNHDNKDILRIKGGENENVIVGSLDLKGYFKYREEYEIKLKEEIEQNLKDFKDKVKKKKETELVKEKIKPLSARHKKKDGVYA